MEPSKLLELATEAAGGELALASLLELKITTAANQFGRWKRGDHKPNYDQTMRLLEIAGLLRQPGELEQQLAEVQELRAELERVARRRRRTQ